MVGADGIHHSFGFNCGISAELVLLVLTAMPRTSVSMSDRALPIPRELKSAHPFPASNLAGSAVLFLCEAESSARCRSSAQADASKGWVDFAQFDDKTKRYRKRL
jgi:hypothetical protein